MKEARSNAATIEAPQPAAPAPLIPWRDMQRELPSDTLACLFRLGPMGAFHVGERVIRADSIDWRGIKPVIESVFDVAVHPHDGIRRAWIDTSYRAFGLDIDE